MVEGVGDFLEELQREAGKALTQGRLDDLRQVEDALLVAGVPGGGDFAGGREVLMDDVFGGQDRRVKLVETGTVHDLPREARPASFRRIPLEEYTTELVVNFSRGNMAGFVKGIIDNPALRTDALKQLEARGVKIEEVLRRIVDSIRRFDREHVFDLENFVGVLLYLMEIDPDRGIQALNEVRANLNTKYLKLILTRLRNRGFVLADRILYAFEQGKMAQTTEALVRGEDPVATVVRTRTSTGRLYAMGPGGVDERGAMDLFARIKGSGLTRGQAFEEFRRQAGETMMDVLEVGVRGGDDVAIWFLIYMLEGVVGKEENLFLGARALLKKLLADLGKEHPAMKKIAAIAQALERKRKLPRE